MRKICNLLIKFSIYGLVVLMPLFWLPWTIEVFEFNKQYLLILLVGLAFLAWLVKLVAIRKKFVFRRTSLDIWVLLFMVIMVLSAAFSIDRVSSWLGFYGRFSDSAISLLALGVMYFVVVNNLRFSKGAASGKTVSWGLSLEKIFGLFLFSSSLVVISTYLSIFNLWSKIPGLPQVMNLRSFNPAGGSLEGLSIFLVMVISMIVGIVLTRIKEQKEKMSLRDNLKSNFVIYYSIILISLILLLLINFWAAWLVLGVTMLVLLVLALWTRMFRRKVNLLFLPIILLIVASIFLSNLPNRVGIMTNSSFLENPLPRELILDYQTTKTVTWQTIKKYPVLGSGPGTFLADFVKFKPVEFNENRFWNVRFDKGPSQILEMVGTTGILGVLSYLLLMVVFLLVSLIALRRIGKNSLADDTGSETVFQDNKEESSVSLMGGQSEEEGGFSSPGSEGAVQGDKTFLMPIFLAWFALLIGQFVYLGNTTLNFYFWFFMALGMISWQRMQVMPSKKMTFSFRKLPEIGLVMNVVSLVLFFALVSSFYLAGRFYWADVKFKQPAADNQEVVANLEKAVNLNRYRENYRRALSQVYLNTAWNEASKPDNEQNIQLLQNLAAGSIQQARLATSLSPNLVMAWENLGAIYRDSGGLVGGTIPFALEAFAKASELEPTNPFFYRELCRLNLTSEEKNWDETVDFCQRAIDLKPNYLDAHIQLALVYELKGDLETALQRMQLVLDKLKGVSFQRGSALAGAATEIYFQLGRLHFNLNQTDQAIRMFEQAVIITPQYANGRYALALSYQIKGRLQDALIQFEIVDQLVPGNQNVQTMIQQLKQALRPAPQPAPQP